MFGLPRNSGSTVMEKVSMIRRFALLAVVGLATVTASSFAQAEEEKTPLLDGKFSFDTLTGTIDRAAAQRGFQVYKEVCSACHGVYELSYRNLEELGYTDDQVKAFAAEAQVNDIGDDGTAIQRPGKPSDRFVRPFANEKAARAANNGAYPPDLALIAKSRKGGANYVYSLLQGFRDAPADVKMGANMNYNIYFSGHQIAMPPPLLDGSVTYADGTANNLNQEAHDVATFLEWAANPELNERKAMGVKVVLFLIVMSGVLFFAKKKIWSDVH